jgi:hypothetical protein
LLAASTRKIKKTHCLLTTKPVFRGYNKFQKREENFMGRRISVDDIGYYADRITVYEKILVKRNTSGAPIYKMGVKEYRVDGLSAQKIQQYFVDGKAKEVLSDPVPLKELYKRIRHVYDFNKVLIARRNTPNQALLITGKGMSKFLKLG